MGVESVIVPLLKPSKKVAIKPFKREDWFFTPRLESCCMTENVRSLACVASEVGSVHGRTSHVCFGVCRR